MKSLSNKAAAVLLSAVISLSAVMTAGCGVSEAKDTEILQDLSTRFIEAISAGDTDAVEELTGEDYTYKFKDESKAAVIQKMASETEVLEFKSINIDREHNKAKVRMKISYIDVYRFVMDSNYFMTEEEYIDTIDSYEDKDTTYFSLTFELKDGQWVVDDKEVKNYMSMFDEPYWIEITQMSEDDVVAAVEGLIPGLADGEFLQEYFEFDLDQVRVFDDKVYQDDLLTEAVDEFTKAYFQYIVDNGITCERIDDWYGYSYTFAISGTAPSKDEILAYLSSDERVIESYMATIRVACGCDYMTEDEIWSSMYAGIYLDLAKMIPDMSGDPFYIEVSIDPTMDVPEFYTYDDIFPITKSDTFEASAISDDQAAECFLSAVESLYLAGEISEEQYEAYLGDMDSGNGIGSQDDYTNEDGYIEWPGTEDHENQAVMVYEYMPSWSDGTLIYGISDVDPQGIWMHYSKEPGWLNTAGYYVDEDGVTIMVTFDNNFAKGTLLEYDWEVGDVVYGETETFYVEENGQDTFEFTLPIDSIPYDGGVEFRLWEEGHQHVIAYVYLTQT